MSNHRKLTPTGPVVRVDEPYGFQPPAYDPSVRAHAWTVATMYRVIPEHWHSTDPDVVPLLDQENLIQVAGPFCYHCERGYDPTLAARPCPGDPS